MKSGEQIGDALDHMAPISRTLFSPDGTTLVTVAETKGIRFWDLATGKPLGNPVEKKTRADITFSADSELIAVLEESGLRLLQVPTGRSVKLPFGKQQPGDSFLVIVGEPYVATLDSANRFRLWDLVTLEALGQPLELSQKPTGFSVTPEQDTVAINRGDGTLQLWDLQTGKTIGSPLVHPQRVSNGSFSDDGKVIITSSGNAVYLWNSNTGKPLGKPISLDAVGSSIFSPDGKAILSSGNSFGFTSSRGVAQLWSRRTRQLIGQPLIHSTALAARAFSPDGMTVLTSDRNGLLRIWRRPDVSPLDRHDWFDSKNWVSAVAVSPDGTTAVIANVSGSASLINLAQGGRIGVPLQHKKNIWDVTFSIDGSKVITASHDGTVRVWDSETSLPIGQPMEHARVMVWSVAVSPDKKTIATGTSYGLLRFWDAESGQLLGRPKQIARSARGNSFGRGIRRVAFNHDGSLLATACTNGTAQLWDPKTRQPVGEPFLHESDVRAVTFSPDGKTLLTGSEDGTARLWDVASHQPVGRPMVHRGAVAAVAFSANGKLIATGSHDKTARLWDPATTLPIGLPMKHRGKVLTVAFTPDNLRLLTGSTDNRARLWQLAQPIDGTPDAIELWTQVKSGMEIDASGAVHVLKSSEWAERKKRLDQLEFDP